ncbi:hypothetical protein KY285_010952 [Solanum tuberosum]|nr:hypothetical protein KY289_025088 [Solanum tuberosum]KAH0720225.1 hypothetical protein KY284_005255 [Solanum tuberosum]KAH0735245.1 hypothetical protein KY285_010952 [Solanum tuberosum]
MANLEKKEQDQAWWEDVSKFYDMVVERLIHLMAKNLYLWMRDIPGFLPRLVKFMEDYTPVIGCKVVKWIKHMVGYKCNLDGASKGNPGPSSRAYCIRDVEGNFVYAEVKRIEDNNNLKAEIKAITMGLEYCRTKEIFPVILETGSLAVKKMIYGEWDVPWSVTMEIRKIKHLMKEREVVIEHVFREGNKELPNDAKVLLNMDKARIANLRIRKMQNTNYRYNEINHNAQ